MTQRRRVQLPIQQAIKGRGAASQTPARFAERAAIAMDDGWGTLAEEIAEDLAHRPTTRIHPREARSIMSFNSSPDIVFDRSVNPYQGCEHACVYCFARPTHSYLDHSPGLDFETEIYAKVNAAEKLRETLRKPGYQVAPIALGVNTDGWQPIERELRISRSLLEVCLETEHPVQIITKSSTLLRDLDVLTALADRQLVSVMISVTTLDNALSAKLEPRAAAPHTRLKNIRALRDAGVPVGMLVAPVIPMINDHELEHMLEAGHAAGALAANHILLRLPHELTDIWREWLHLHYPERAAHAMSLLQQSRGGKDYDSDFKQRMRGTGPFADLITQRVRKTKQRLGFAGMPALDVSRFHPPAAVGDQGNLF
ncbi:PA0069 family radical SAM protein [Lysobacter sp. HDW10]|uniref:PA0069 family radical SAM protein n=1 Tax=Lysobacter sp. HDW10 TaxID=2714936 RepID=UPI0014097ACE|nr:PA0069 family radical SAM protein [Lysobacter sp. HDW10]QIK80777.1 PA0069 family radical SAM protein [Lysobacter sp. HDW10]